MNEYEIRKMSFVEALEKFGEARSEFNIGDIVIIDHATTEFTPDDMNTPFRKSITISRIIRDLSEKVEVEDLVTIDEGADRGIPCPDKKTVISKEYISRAASDRLKDTDGI
jgi:hypothetical protein